MYVALDIPLQERVCGRGGNLGTSTAKAFPRRESKLLRKETQHTEASPWYQAAS